MMLMAGQAYGNYSDDKMEAWMKVSECSAAIERDNIRAKHNIQDGVAEGDKCEREMDVIIKIAAKGNDGAYDGLILGIDTELDSGDRVRIAYGKKLEKKIQMAQQRAMLKATTKKK